MMAAVKHSRPLCTGLTIKRLVALATARLSLAASTVAHCLWRQNEAGAKSVASIRRQMAIAKTCNCGRRGGRLKMSEFSQWSFLRAVLEQGMAIQQDYAAGKYAGYEDLSCRLDEAARERDQQMRAQQQDFAAKDRELAEKQAEVERYKAALLEILRDSGSQTVCSDGPRHTGWHFIYDTAKLALWPEEIQLAALLAHPDTARLDKLPQCFHMLRTGAGVLAPGQYWWLTYDPNKTYASVREAIDAHREPKL